jgi:hypothetical protein
MLLSISVMCVSGCYHPPSGPEIVEACSKAGHPPGSPGYMNCFNSYFAGDGSSGGTPGLEHRGAAVENGRYDRATGVFGSAMGGG